MAKQIIVTKDNYGIEIITSLVNQNKESVDVTGQIVEVVIVDDNDTIVDKVEAQHIDSSRGIVSITLQKEHTSTIGLYKTYWSALDKNNNVTAQEDIYYYCKDKNGGVSDDSYVQEEKFDSESIIDKFKETDAEIESIKQDLSYLHKVNVNAELVDARGEYDTLGERLDVVDNDLTGVHLEMESINASLAHIAHQVNEDNLEDLKKYKNIIFEANTVINSDVEITLIENAVIDFNNCTINGNLKITRNKNCTFKNRVNVKKDIILLGGFGCTFDILNCELLYIQNYVGWGGFYWNVFNEINCKAMQVRQARLKSGTSALNSNTIKKLIAQWGLARNNWINVWFRGYGSDFIYTEEGTEPSLQGADKWDIVTCNPLVIDNIDFSYSNAEEGATSYGIVNESTRVIKIQNGFIENIDIAIKGNIICENVELRNTSLEQITGENNFTTSDEVGKIGGFIRTSQPIIKDCYFSKGLTDYVKTGDVTITRDGNTNNIYGRVCKLNNTSSGKSKITYSFTSDRTDFISITVLGKNIGVINCSDGSNHQYNLGHLKINNQVGYSVGRATVTKGNKVDVAIYSHDIELTEIYAIQIFYGKDGGTIYGDKIISSLPTHSSNTQSDWKTAFTLDYIKGATTEIEFKVTGNIVGQGNIKGIYKGVINIDDELMVTDNLKSFVYTNGGKSLFDIQFVLNGDKIECQFAKGYYGSGCIANFIDIKVNELFVVNVIN